MSQTASMMATNFGGATDTLPITGYSNSGRGGDNGTEFKDLELWKSDLIPA